MGSYHQETAAPGRARMQRVVSRRPGKEEKSRKAGGRWTSGWRKRGEMGESKSQRGNPSFEKKGKREKKTKMMKSLRRRARVVAKKETVKKQSLKKERRRKMKGKSSQEKG